MAVNFIRIRSTMIYPLSSLWNVYTQILRHNSENKDKLKLFLNNIAENNKKKPSVHEVETSKHISNYHDELVSNYDEEKLLNRMINQKQEMTRVKWINFRNDCLQHVSEGKCSSEFFEKFIKFIYINDPKYYEENESLLEFLKNFMLWRQHKSDIDVIIKSLSKLHQQSLVGGNESLMYHLKVITQILDDVLNKHGSSAVVKLRNSFETICEKSHDYELLYILWTKLFESFWYSDQKFSEEIIERHEEVRNLLATRSKQICFKYFQSANTELVNKVIQIFLRHNMRTNATDVIKMYLAYECWRKNSQAATEVVKLCVELNIPLSDNENKKFLNLLLGRSSSPPSEMSKQHDARKKIDIKKYKFQF